jgi:plastocyanin
VLDRNGQPVQDAVVTASAEHPVQTAPPASSPRAAIMDQVDRQFVPHILVIQVGAAVIFPNSDKVSHQVYSFSPAKRFQLALYHGHPYPPLIFDQPGIVVLGCNIHDDMIGYIYVTPTPYFGKTDASGSVTLNDLSPRPYELSVWSPRFNEPQAEIKMTVAAGPQGAAIEVRLTRELKPELKRKSIKASWHDY